MRGVESSTVPPFIDEELDMRFRQLAMIIPVLVVAGVALDARAIVIEQPITRQYLAENTDKFTVTAEKRDDGLVHFTIGRNLTEPRYLVASLVLRDGDNIVLRTDFPAIARDKTATYYAALQPDRVADAQFELTERGFSENNSHPLPGGINYRLNLRDFMPSDAEPSTK
jgi:hypothetical protein